METIYNLINLYVVPFWALMILAPHWSWTKRIMNSFWPVYFLPVVYVILLVSQIVGPGIPVDFSLNGIAAFLGNSGGAILGWAHFLAFDLFVGRWVYLDSQERGISWWVVSPFLFLVLMAGPLGLLAYLMARLVKKFIPYAY